MAAVRDTVVALGGKLSVENERGHGTTLLDDLREQAVQPLAAGVALPVRHGPLHLSDQRAH